MTELSWNDLFLQDARIDFERIVSCWPQLTGKVGPIGLSAFGDLFFARPDETVWVLDTFSGEVRRVAASQVEFSKLMNSQPWQQENLRSLLVLELRDRGLTRGPGQVFAPVPHPIHAGSVRLEGTQVMDAVVWHSISSQCVAQPGPAREYQLEQKPWWKFW